MSHFSPLRSWGSTSSFFRPFQSLLNVIVLLCGWLLIVLPTYTCFIPEQLQRFHVGGHYQKMTSILDQARLSDSYLQTWTSRTRVASFVLKLCFLLRHGWYSGLLRQRSVRVCTRVTLWNENALIYTSFLRSIKKQKAMQKGTSECERVKKELRNIFEKTELRAIFLT